MIGESQNPHPENPWGAAPTMVPGVHVFATRRCSHRVGGQQKLGGNSSGQPASRGHVSLLVDL